MAKKSLAINPEAISGTKSRAAAAEHAINGINGIDSMTLRQAEEAIMNRRNPMHQSHGFITFKEYMPSILTDSQLELIIYKIKKGMLLRPSESYTNHHKRNRMVRRSSMTKKKGGKRRKKTRKKKTRKKRGGQEKKVGQEWKIKNKERLAQAFGNNPVFSFIKIRAKAETPLGGPGKRWKVSPSATRNFSSNTLDMYEFAINKNYNLIDMEPPATDDEEEEVVDDLKGGRRKKKTRKKRKRKGRKSRKSRRRR